MVAFIIKMLVIIKKCGIILIQHRTWTQYISSNAEYDGKLLSEHVAYLDIIGMRREGLFSKICYASYPYGFV